MGAEGEDIVGAEIHCELLATVLFFMSNDRNDEKRGIRGPEFAELACWVEL